MLEEEAQGAYMNCKARRIEEQSILMDINVKKNFQLGTQSMHLEAYKSKELYLVRLDDEERSQKSIISILEDEEENARLLWIERRKETKAIEKLYDKQYSEWLLEANRAEQNELDEFAIQKRSIWA